MNTPETMADDLQGEHRVERLQNDRIVPTAHEHFAVLRPQLHDGAATTPAAVFVSALKYHDRDSRQHAVAAAQPAHAIGLEIPLQHQ